MCNIFVHVIMYTVLREYHTRNLFAEVLVEFTVCTILRL